jgi:hypothetical protein
MAKPSGRFRDFFLENILSEKWLKVKNINFEVIAKVSFSGGPNL